MPEEDAFRKCGQKRDPGRGAEPGYHNPRCGGRRFLVHKHAARRLHYDFRLEAIGALKSWAVLRAPSANPSDNGSRCGPRTTRSSSRTSKARSPRVNTQPARSPCGMQDLRRPDQGQCRAGTPVAEAAERGHLAVFLHGHKLIGGCALTRIGPAGERWLLVKEADEYAGRTRDPVRSQPESVKTGPRQRRTDRVKGMCVLPNAQAASSSARLIMGRPGPPAFITMIIIFAGKGVAIEVPYQDHASNSDKPSSWWPRDHAASRSHGPPGRLPDGPSRPPRPQAGRSRLQG